jgi:hypothetical protein
VRKTTAKTARTTTKVKPPATISELRSAVDVVVARLNGGTFDVEDVATIVMQLRRATRVGERLIDQLTNDHPTVCDLCGGTDRVTTAPYVCGGRTFDGPVCWICRHCEECGTEFVVGDNGDIRCQGTTDACRERNGQ